MEDPNIFLRLLSSVYVLVRTVYYKCSVLDLGFRPNWARDYTVATT